jgi:hypothetical protein
MNCEHCPVEGSCLAWPAFCEWAAEDPPDPVRLAHIRNRSAMGENPPAAYPSPARLAANLATDLWSWAVSGFMTTTEEERVRRISICEACEYFDPGPRRCKHLGCGCYLDEAVKLKTKHCPLKPPKW